MPRKINLEQERIIKVILKHIRIKIFEDIENYDIENGPFEQIKYALKKVEKELKGLKNY